MSPGYPAAYPSNQDKVTSTILLTTTITTFIFYCQIWRLEVTSGEKILLTFETFDVQSGMTVLYPDYKEEVILALTLIIFITFITLHCQYLCDYDFVQISYGSFEEQYCGSSIPGPIISSGNTMTVIFHSDHSENRNGFRATWKAVGSSGTLYRNIFAASNGGGKN